MLRDARVTTEARQGQVDWLYALVLYITGIGIHTEISIVTFAATLRAFFEVYVIHIISLWIQTG